jgi:hypothetical protein
MSSPFVFNSGAVYTIDGDAVPTPVQVGILQSASIKLKSTTKELYGQQVLPVASGRSQIKVSGDFEFASYTGRLIRDFFGSSMAAGQILVVQDEPGTIPASGPFTISTANHTAFGVDLGVRYAATQVPLSAVASSPATGQYSYSAGVYTFAAADDGLAVLISYTYTSTGAGDVITITNANAGAATSFKSVFAQGYGGSQVNFTLNSCIPDSLDLLGSKIGDFSKPKYSFNAITDSSNILGTISVPLVS